MFSGRTFYILGPLQVGGGASAPTSGALERVPPGGQTASEHCGSSSLLILLAKSEIRVIYVQYEPENRVCQRTHACETDFASSITFGDDI
jgi:hypothetical protein